MSLVQRRNICLLIVVCCLCIWNYIFISDCPNYWHQEASCLQSKNCSKQKQVSWSWSMKHRSWNERERREAAGQSYPYFTRHCCRENRKYFLKQTTNNFETEIILLLAWSAVNDDCNYFLSEIGYFFHTSCWNLPTYRYFVGVRR